MFTVDLVNTTAEATSLVAGKATIQITDASSTIRYITKLMSASCFTTDGSTLSWTRGSASASQAALEVVPMIPTSITRSPATMSLVVGATSQITASVVPSGADQTVTYASSAPSFATVSGSGLVTAVGAGSATITITSTALNTVTATIATTVSLPSVTGITATPPTMSLAIGNTSQITASVQPGGAAQGITYTSSNTAIATVSSSGLVTAVANGTATITVMSSANNSFTTPVAVTVA